MTDSEHHFDPERMMDSLYWWGIPTFFRCPYETDPKNCDIGLVGVPHSTGNGTTERDQHMGPRAVRNMSALGRRVHMKFGFSPWEATRIADVGDVPFPEANDNEACIQRITDFITRLDEAGTHPVSMGGDHSITGGIVQALGRPGSTVTGGKPVALLHLDAHTDVYEHLDHWLGAKKSAAHWGSYLVHQGNVNAHKSVQIGMRGNTRTLDWLQPSYDLGYEVIDMERYREIGANKSMEIINKRLGDEPVYITFDLDCLDATVAPAVSNLEPGVNGFSIDEAVQLLQSVRGKNVIGGDVVCLMPTKDHPNNITSMVAYSIMFEIMCLVADNISNR